MIRQRLDLPLAEDSTGRFLVWIMAVMVYLAILALQMLQYTMSLVIAT